MKKRIITLTLGLTLAFTSTVFGQDVKVKLDNEYVRFNQQTGYPFIDENSRTQVPFRATVETFKADVDWDSETYTAIAEKSGTIVKVPIGKTYIFKNDEKIINDTEALIKDGRTYLPIRVVLESFGADVDWKDNAVVITTEKVEKEVPKVTTTNTYDKYGIPQQPDYHFRKSNSDKYEGLMSIKNYNNATIEYTKEQLKIYFPNDYEKVYNEFIKVIEGKIGEIGVFDFKGYFDERLTKIKKFEKSTSIVIGKIGVK